MLALIVQSLAQGPGDGIAKTTYAASNPFPGLAFNLKYFPTTAAIDSCSGNYCTASESPDGEKAQGRAQLIDPGFYTQRNCALYSATGGYTADSAVTNMLAATSLGGDCSYYPGYKFDTDKGTLLYVAFAPTADTCCKACAATQGCTAAAFYTGADYVVSSWDTTATRGRRLQPEPYRGEGFGLHLVDVKSSSTSGGIAVSALEANFAARLGSLTKFDAFMDYSVQLFTADLRHYAKVFLADKVPTFAASWTATSSSDTWYSLFVHVPQSQMVVELVGLDAPSANAAFTKIEARVSPRNIALYKDTAKESLHLLYATSVTRATSNITAVHMFYTDVIKATVVDSVDADGVSRRCYKWGSARSDVCFVQREDASDATFTVKAFEKMLWSVHATNLLAPTNGDKYNDNHYAADLQISGDYIVTYMKKANPYPITSSSWWAYACTQSYLIDPTGWTIQTDLSFTQSYEGCSYTAAQPPATVEQN